MAKALRAIPGTAARITPVSIDADGETAGESGGNSGDGSFGSGNSGIVSPNSEYVSVPDGWGKTGDTWKHVFKGFNEKTGYASTESLEESSGCKTIGESTITIDGSVQNYATFTNREGAAYGNLCVEKKATETGSAQPFDFTLTLTGDGFSGKKTIGGMVFEDGKASFSLSNRQKLSIRSIPAGTGYSIQETENENFTASHSIDRADAEVGSPAIGCTAGGSMGTEAASHICASGMHPRRAGRYKANGKNASAFAV